MADLRTFSARASGWSAQTPCRTRKNAGCSGCPVNRMHGAHILDADEVFRRNEICGTSIIPASPGKDYEATRTRMNDSQREF